VLFVQKERDALSHQAKGRQLQDQEEEKYFVDFNQYYRMVPGNSTND
jgi:hypothetical protein